MLDSMAELSPQHRERRHRRHCGAPMQVAHLDSVVEPLHLSVGCVGGWVGTAGIWDRDSKTRCLRLAGYQKLEKIKHWPSGSLEDQSDTTGWVQLFYNSNNNAFLRMKRHAKFTTSPLRPKNTSPGFPLNVERAAPRLHPSRSMKGWAVRAQVVLRIRSPGAGTWN